MACKRSEAVAQLALARPSAPAQTRSQQNRVALGCLMLRYDDQLPALLPMLSRGKHRSPRKGACFMEFASLLAGERWSDHPACTHPLLAAVARHVNDHTSDAGRARLVGLIPSVIGLTGDDPRIDARIALRSATTALPVVAAERQRVMAVSRPTWTGGRSGISRHGAGRRWRGLLTPRPGPTASPPAAAGRPPGAFAGRPRRPSSASPLKGSRRPACRPRTRCSATCLSRRSANARRWSAAIQPRRHVSRDPGTQRRHPHPDCAVT